MIKPKRALQKNGLFTNKSLLLAFAFVAETIDGPRRQGAPQQKMSVEMSSSRLVSDGIACGDVVAREESGNALTVDEMLSLHVG
jgi:hypothetical protein